jgi:MFS family permease
MINFFKKNNRAFIGGIITTVTIGLGVFLLGNISGYEAKKLLDSSMQGLNMLCNTIVLASATILALLLTLLGISTGTDTKLREKHYKQVLNIAKFDTILFISALVLFQFFNIPITEADNVDVSWYKYIYWATLFSSSIISGMMVMTILMLYGTVTNIIAIVGLKQSDHRMLANEDENDNVEDEEMEK